MKIKLTQIQLIQKKKQLKLQQIEFYQKIKHIHKTNRSDQN